MSLSEEESKLFNFVWQQAIPLKLNSLVIGDRPRLTKSRKSNKVGNMTQTMPVGFIVHPNAKWQITIPAKLRKQTGLSNPVPFNVVAKNSSIIFTAIEEVKSTQEPWSVRRKRLLEFMQSDKQVWSKAEYQDWESRMKEVKTATAKKVRKLKKAW